MKESKIYKVVIADPSAIVGGGLERILDADPQYHVAGRFTDYHAFMDKVWQIKPDVILFNPVLVSSHKRFSIKNLLKENREAVVLAVLYSWVSPEIVAEFDDAIDVFEPPEKILRKIHAAIERSASHANNDQQTNDAVELSDREKEILISVAQGLTNKEIAEKHNISIHTVISHRKNISRKTNIRTVSGLTVYAMLNNLLP